MNLQESSLGRGADEMEEFKGSGYSSNNQLKYQSLKRQSNAKGKRKSSEKANGLKKNSLNSSKQSQSSRKQVRSS